MTRTIQPKYAILFFILMFLFGALLGPSLGDWFWSYIYSNPIPQNLWEVLT